MSARSLSTWIVAVAVLAPPSLPLRAADPEVSKEVIAVQLRKQGFECRNPASAKRAADSQTDEPAWIIACEGVSYKVVLVPKQAAKVEKIKNAPAEAEQPATGPKP